MHRFHPKSVQLGLFGPPDDSQPLDTPRWRSLPDRTRRRATGLITQMLLEHRDSPAEGSEAGTGEESGDV